MRKKNNINGSSKLISIHSIDHPEFEKLVGDVVHKLKNNLGGLSGFATLLERDVGEDPSHRRIIGQIQSIVMRLDELMVDLMLLIRKVNISSEPVCINSLLSNLLSQYQERHHLKCQTEYYAPKNTDKIILNTDSDIIERLFLYIIRFAEQANAVVKNISISQDSALNTCIDIQIDHLDLDEYSKNSIATILSTYEPVEARLALAIIIKLIEVLGGHGEMCYKSKESISLAIQIS